MPYASLSELRAEGVHADEYPDMVVESALAFAAEYIERICSQFFEPRSEAREYDGTGGSLLVLDTPLLTLSKLEWQEFSESWTAQPVRDFAVYNRIPQDQHYPRIAIKDTGNHSIQSRQLGVFPEGTLNIRVTGSWGFVEKNDDGSFRVPLLINKVCKILAVAWIDNTGDGSLMAVLKSYGFTEEQTKTHRYKLSAAMADGTLTGIGIIDSILLMFKRRSSGAGSA
ncbi:MAG: hypothetical protein ACO1RX_20145 [Candidatus Sericytochromatia bacterium]